MWYVIPKDELYHHGIKGQKWGVRRFQNPDGSVTSAGAERYYVGGKKAMGDKGGSGNKGGSSDDNNKTTVKSTSGPGYTKHEISSNSKNVRSKERDALDNDVKNGARWNDDYEDIGMQAMYAFEKEGPQAAAKYLDEHFKNLPYDLNAYDEDGYLYGMLTIYGNEYAYSVGVEPGYCDDGGYEKL